MTTVAGEYKTEIGAKRAANKNLNSVVVRFPDGSYDWFPPGHPVGEYVGGGRFVKAVPDRDYINVAQWDVYRYKWCPIGD